MSNVNVMTDVGCSSYLTIATKRKTKATKKSIVVNIIDIETHDGRTHYTLREVHTFMHFRCGSKAETKNKTNKNNTVVQIEIDNSNHLI